MSTAPHEPALGVTVKADMEPLGAAVYPPLLAEFLIHRLKVGQSLAVKGFLGGYTLEDDVESAFDHVLHLCAGSGSVPNLSILKDSLHRHTRLRHTLVYSSRTWQDVIFLEALHTLCRRNAERLRVIHWLTRETEPLPHAFDVRRGRIPIDLLRDILQNEPRSMVYVCGPAITVWERRACEAAGVAPAPRFIESMLGHLATLRVPKTCIRMEAFG